MKKYIRSSIKPKTVEYKKKYINQVIQRIRSGTASQAEIFNACDMISWLWKFRHIDEATKNELADTMTNALDDSLF